MTDITKCMTPYADIQPIKTDVSIEDYIQSLSMFSSEMAGRLKYAFEKSKKQKLDFGYYDGYQNGYENGYAARGLDDC